MKTIHHVAIICSDRDKALAFYHEKLGLPIIREHYREKRGQLPTTEVAGL